MSEERDQPILAAQLSRFGLDFEVKYKVGTPQAALYVGGALQAWLSVGYAGRRVFFDSDKEQRIIPFRVFGLDLEDVSDAKFVLEAEEYVLTKLADELTAALRVNVTREDMTDPCRFPRQRGERVTQALADTGVEVPKSVWKLLPHLVATEIFDALEMFGEHLADEVEANDAPGSAWSDCALFIREQSDQTLQEWRDQEDES